MWAEAEEAGGRRQEAEEEARKAAGRRGDSKEGRQTGRQAAAEKGARRGMTESTSRTVYLTDFQDFRALNGFPSFSTPDSCEGFYRVFASCT